MCHVINIFMNLLCLSWKCTKLQWFTFMNERSTSKTYMTQTDSGSIHTREKIIVKLHNDQYSLCKWEDADMVHLVLCVWCIYEGMC